MKDVLPSKFWRNCCRLFVRLFFILFQMTQQRQIRKSGENPMRIPGTQSVLRARTRRHSQHNVFGPLHLAGAKPTEIVRPVLVTPPPPSWHDFKTNTVRSWCEVASTMARISKLQYSSCISIENYAVVVGELLPFLKEN